MATGDSEPCPILGRAAPRDPDQLRAACRLDAERSFDLHARVLTTYVGAHRTWLSGLALARTASRTQNPRVYNTAGLRLEQFFDMADVHHSLEKPMARLASSWRTWLKCPGSAAEVDFTDALRRLEAAQAVLREDVYQTYGNNLTVYLALAAEISRARYPLVYSEACANFGELGDALVRIAKKGNCDAAIWNEILATATAWRSWSAFVADDE